MNARRLTVLAAALMTGAGLVQAAKAQAAEALAKRSGCLECHHPDKRLVGPSFRDIAARAAEDSRGYGLSVMAVSSLDDLPEKRKSRVIVAKVGEHLHIRIFDSAGRRVVDAPEGKLTDAARLGDLRRRLPRDGGAPSPEEQRGIIAAAAAAAGYTQDRARDKLSETIKQGGKGNWTAFSKGVPMPPFSHRLTDEQIKSLLNWILRPADAVDLKVMRMGLGSGTVSSNPAGIDCGGSCDATYSPGVRVALRARPHAGSVFVCWQGDATGTTNPVSVTMSESRSVRAVFGLATAIPPLNDLTPHGIREYLAANTAVTSPARFISALKPEFRQNWIFMSRSESLQTGTAESPRLLLPSADARAVFAIGMTRHNSYPGSHPNAVEYMQWEAAEKNFRFHEIVLDDIPAAGGFPARARGVSADDRKCFKCHSTQNVLNCSRFPGTTGFPPGTIKFKSKPNWDAYDSWGGMMSFNRDRIYPGSVEAAAFRKLLNLWTWRNNDSVRSIIEQLDLQPPRVNFTEVIRRHNGGVFDGHIVFPFDESDFVVTEPPPLGAVSDITTNYSFDGLLGSGVSTRVVRGGDSVTLHHSSIPALIDGRGVHFFDILGGNAGTLNPQRIADELIHHRFATGGAPVDVRPIALAITRGLVSVDAATNTVVGTPPLCVNLGFFDARNGMRIKELVDDTRCRAQSIPRRKADIQKRNLDRTGDVYLSTARGGAANGLVQQYGAATSAGIDTSLGRLRQEVFRRPIDDAGNPDKTPEMRGIYNDREFYSLNTEKVALYRYFLEPLGVSVDKWSMGVRGRSRSYAFADVFGRYINTFAGDLTDSIKNDPRSTGLTPNFTDDQLIAAVNATLAASVLPPADTVPTYTDIQRIFNKSCVECHGGLNYPPYSNYLPPKPAFPLDFSEDESPPAGKTRLDRALAMALAHTTSDPMTSLIYLRTTRGDERCPFGLMPCGGPALSKTDTETIRRWIVGGRPSTVGAPHIQTVDGVDYDFQAAGEFVLLRGDDLEIQVRQTAVNTAVPLGPNRHTGLTSGVSVNTAVALRLGGRRITYQPNLNGKPDPTGLQLRVDGKLQEMTKEGIPPGPAVRILPTIAPGGLQVEAPGGTVVVITPAWWEHTQLWYLNIDTRHVRGTQGLMGTVAPGNWLPALPNGTLLGPKPEKLEQRYKDLYDKFGNAWRVGANSAFDYAPGTDTKTYSFPEWPGFVFDQHRNAPREPGAPPPKPPQQPLDPAQAKQLAKDILDGDRQAKCILDLLVTGEPGMANTYLLADRIQRNKLPPAPVLVSPEDFKTDVPPTVTFTWNRSVDPDGDTVTYRLYVWPVGERPDTNQAVRIAPAEIKADSGTVSRTVTKLEPGRAYFWKVIAEDGKGGTVESETRRFEVK